MTNDTKKVVVTGGSGKAGRVCVGDLIAHGYQGDAVTFSNNTLSTYNVFEAARRLGIKNIVWASSETVLGLPFETPPPYVPVDEEYPGRPESAYSLSKQLDPNETLLSIEKARRLLGYEPQHSWRGPASQSK